MHKRVGYRIVYDVSDERKEVLIIFLGTRENFYKELKRYLSWEVITTTLDFIPN